MALGNDFKIKPSLKRQWKEAVGNNACDPYSFCVVIAVCASFEVLDRGGSPEDAEKEWSERKLGLSGFMAGAAAKMIGRYHERGDEFRKHWNQKFGVTEEQARGGTVNPAIVEMKIP